MGVLITGATGFLGKNIFEALKARGCENITVLSRTTSPAFPKQVLISSFNGYVDFSNALKDVEVIIHCAARVHVMNDESNTPLDDFREVNTDGSLNLARQAVSAGVKRFIFISSIKVNGEATTLSKPFKSIDERLPTDFYGKSKSEAEEQLLQLAEDTGLEVVIVRPTLIYGPDVKANFASLMNLVSKGFPLPVGCIRDNKRSLVSVKNLTDLIITCIDHPKATNQVFLVSDDHDLSTSEIVYQIAQALGKPTWQMYVPVWCYKVFGKVFNQSYIVDRLTGSLQVDITHTKETLAWEPPQSLQEGFKQTAEAFLQSKKISGKS
ncbi:NAD-dependent epimerase/dehydratase [Vibrio ichthyoenteri ATCC 700023]|uniref:NAD-dependent epimerase/dehydratase n=1 Tax=Vibrio ichthyoenteri ATCC 700023 TaxID=870968 RepID=F9S4P0_9VIBR|nr:SDR family oxidoreductase [Vibrio ichthyoenteri]EGU36730.1 NAD-dependent epimerase/dehydratase [Vibrio ichthyoenteri ATCC 700023]